MTPHSHLRTIPRAKQYQYLFSLPDKFPDRHEMPFNRLAKSDREALKTIKHYGYDQLCNELNNLLVAYAAMVDGVTDLSGMTRRQYTLFRVIYRYWVQAGRKYARQMVIDNHGKPENLMTVLTDSTHVYGQFMTITDGDMVRSRDESLQVLVDYLRPKRAYLRAFTGHFPDSVQETIYRVSQWVFYERTGDDIKDTIGVSPIGHLVVAECDDEYESDDDYDYVEHEV